MTFSTRNISKVLIPLFGLSNILFTSVNSIDLGPGVLPACAYSCLTKEATKSVCASLTDFNCLCKDSAYMAQVNTCLHTKCEYHALSEALRLFTACDQAYKIVPTSPLPTSQSSTQAQTQVQAPQTIYVAVPAPGGLAASSPLLLSPPAITSGAVQVATSPPPLLKGPPDEESRKTSLDATAAPKNATNETKTSTVYPAPKSGPFLPSYPPLGLNSTNSSDAQRAANNSAATYRSGSMTTQSIIFMIAVAAALT